jgi:hypothetical protein
MPATEAMIGVQHGERTNAYAAPAMSAWQKDGLFAPVGLVCEHSCVVLQTIARTPCKINIALNER